MSRKTQSGQESSFCLDDVFPDWILLDYVRPHSFDSPSICPSSHCSPARCC
jgi:hypothetical protein